MSSDEYTDRKRLKQAFLKKAINEGRGPEVIAKLSQLARNKRDTFQTDDQQLLAGYSQTFEALAQDRPARADMLECLNKTDFNREETQQIKEFMLQDLAEQELAIDLLRIEGVPARELPVLSVALARMNAYTRERAMSLGESWDEYSESNPRFQRARLEAREILSRQNPQTTDGALVRAHSGESVYDKDDDLAKPDIVPTPRFTLN